MVLRQPFAESPNKNMTQQHISEMGISSPELKAISAESRRQILESLRERRRTLSELSKVLGIKPSSVKQHLSILEDSGFIKQIDEGRKWKYYELTSKGAGLFSPNEHRISVLVVFSSVLFVFAFAVYLFYSGLSSIATASHLESNELLAYGSIASESTSENATDYVGSSNVMPYSSEKEQSKVMQEAKPLQEGGNIQKPSFDFSILALAFILASLSSFAIGFLLPKAMKYFALGRK